ncbi:hypothetical protein [Marinigracilibium pacificum]|uniref:Uncharacterized protein n=1 Tax=Marinigracilibium pacificum TaxID=2729599 RepID=A0A848J1A0_9BACT|nr:hypothetical protein [Marinigracilibium pacificum]NMM50337.1 hypothetical protein [Marinigracilibium pacificum]
MPSYNEEIKNTGFILEHSINVILQNHDWTIINNKYYEDDLQNTVREIDILAYKVQLVDDIRIYTTLLISCKKNSENAWVLVSREVNLNNPNFNWNPLHIRTNDSAIKDLINKEKDINKDYYEFLSKENSIDIMDTPKNDVFAFQEMSKRNGAPKNDKNIFTSITSLMKAQAYEIDRKRVTHSDKAVYQFNLISIIDSDLIRLNMLDDKTITQEEIESEQIVTQYIIRRKEDFYRIQFIKADVFEKYLKKYDRIHEANLRFFKNNRDNFFVDILKNDRKVELLKPEFLEEILDPLYEASSYSVSKESVSKYLELIWDIDGEIVRIYLNEEQKIIDRLNDSDSFCIKTKEALNKIYRYDGGFIYSSDNLPF